MEKTPISKNNYEKSLDFIGKDIFSRNSHSPGIKKTSKLLPSYSSILCGDSESLCGLYGNIFGRKFRAEVMISIEPKGTMDYEIGFDYFNIRPIGGQVK